MEIWKKDSTCCVRIINHRGREVRPYPQKAKRGDSASDNSEGRRETHFVTPGGENTSLYTGRYRSLEDWRVPTCLALSIAM